MKKATIIVIALALAIGISMTRATAAEKKLPDVVVLGTLSKVFEPVQFNHAEHVSNAGGCADCHHQHRALDVQSCSECHRIDPSVFKKDVIATNLKPCRACHTASGGPGGAARTSLKAAYHQACFQCHWGDVGSAGKNLNNCTEMCHVPKAGGK